jgi:hypothetical protein
MPRETVDAKTLVNWLNEEMKKQPRCARCSIFDVYKLPIPGLDGCNWSLGVVLCGASSPHSCELGLNAAHVLAKQRFNLA